VSERRQRQRRRRRPEHEQSGVVRALGLGLITGAADDDPSAIGTYAAAGAKMGPSFLWIAPVMFPMMFAVVYLSARLGLVTGKGLFGALRDRYPRWVLNLTLFGVLIGNTFEASADIGGIAAAVDVLLPIPHRLMVAITALTILALQLFASYVVIRNVFRWLSLALLAYLASAILARPDLLTLLKGTFVPTIRFDQEFLAMLVAVMGATLSAYLYTWQSNEEVEEKIAKGLRRTDDRAGSSSAELKKTRRDVLFGMIFSNLIMYFILLSTASTLFKAGNRHIESAAQAAQALRPLAGNAAGALFAVGIVAVGFLAVPVMTAGAAYDLAQTAGWRHGLGLKPREAKKFYGAIVLITAAAAGFAFIGFNPMRVLVWAGIVQGFSTPPLMLLIMLMTNDRRVMGDRVNGRGINILGWLTTAATFAATIALIVSAVR
jgi:NRAMP (natural resistance-associated macrophage protein)-like metal ion transporter